MNKGFTMTKQLILSIALCVMAAEAEQLPNVNDLLKKIEAHTTMTSDAKAQVDLTQQKGKQGAKNLSMIWYRRDSDDAFMIILTGPENEKGNGYLRVGDNFWMYRRNTRTFQHINRDENIGGSDAQADDFETRKLTELYAPAADASGKPIIAAEMLGNIAVWRLELKAIVNDVDYPKKIYWVRQDNALVLKEQSYALSGTLMQTAYSLKYTTINGKYVPVEQVFVDEFEKGNKTMMKLSGIATEKLPDEIFTKAYLENMSK